MLKTLGERKARRRIAISLCASLSAQARDHVFFATYGVSDTMDGRFDVLVLHAWMVLEALGFQGEQELAQSLVDVVFVRLDEALREQGAGDMGMSRRIKKMASAFYGRLRAYDEARNETELGAALIRNLYRGDTSHIEQASQLAKYVIAARARLGHSRLADGEAEFGSVPALIEINGDDHDTPRTLH
ncbi:MAG TPA: ubiquinol-cytochrome C chaperone family protein [Rhizomicrobium sp.]|jgi:cytochrome b pre-mRNA-processing protein 3